MVLGAQNSIVGDRPLLTAADVAILLGVDERTVRRNSHAGRLPKPVRVTARCIRWRRDELLAWLDAGSPSRQQWEAMRDG